MKMNSQRYQLFKKKGTVCISCGREGTHFKMQRDRKSKSYHFGLWSDDEIQLTKDHIIPKSKGGANNLSNYQTMCTVCNGYKSNDLTKDDLENGSFKQTVTETEKIKPTVNLTTSFDRLKNSHYPENDIDLIINELEIFQRQNHINPYETVVPDINDKAQLIIGFYHKLLTLNFEYVTPSSKMFNKLPKKTKKRLFEQVTEEKLQI